MVSTVHATKALAVVTIYIYYTLDILLISQTDDTECEQANLLKELMFFTVLPNHSQMRCTI